MQEQKPISRHIINKWSKICGKKKIFKRIQRKEDIICRERQGWQQISCQKKYRLKDSRAKYLK